MFCQYSKKQKYIYIYIHILAPSNGWCLNPEWLQNGTPYHPTKNEKPFVGMFWTAKTSEKDNVSPVSGDDLAFIYQQKWLTRMVAK